MEDKEIQGSYVGLHPTGNMHPDRQSSKKISTFFEWPQGMSKTNPLTVSTSLV